MVFLQTCQDIGFPVSSDKTEWASEMKVFLGLLIHAKEQLIGIPQEKLEKTEALVNYFLKHKRPMIRQYMSLAGHLNFLTRTLDFRRTFLRGLYNQIKPWQKRIKCHVAVSEIVKEDLRMW